MASVAAVIPYCGLKRMRDSVQDSAADNYDESSASRGGVQTGVLDPSTNFSQLSVVVSLQSPSTVGRGSVGTAHQSRGSWCIDSRGSRRIYRLMLDQRDPGE